MNRELFGEKCSCSHHESDHSLQRHDFSEPRAIPETGILFTHPQGMVKEPVRSGCKICDCSKFDSKKRG